MTDIRIGEEYGTEHAGVYFIRSLNWGEGKELLRKAIRSKDPTDYIEELVIKTVTKQVEDALSPIHYSKEALATLPSGLVRRLMDETLRLNDISRPEANFLPT